MRGLNSFIAARITMIVGTMECAYAFLIFALVPIFAPASQTFVMFISSSVLQLVLLPLIMVGTRVLNQASEDRAAQDHQILLDEFSNLKRIEDNLSKIASHLGLEQDSV